MDLEEGSKTGDTLHRRGIQGIGNCKGEKVESLLEDKMKRYIRFRVKEERPFPCHKVEDSLEGVTLIFSKELDTSGLIMEVCWKDNGK